MGPIVNKTTNPEIAWRVKDAIVRELGNWPGVRILSEDKADSILTGEVLFYRPQIPYTYDSSENPVEYKLEMMIDLSLRDKGGAIIQRIPNLREEEIYRTSPNDLGMSKREEQQAMERALKRMIREAIDQFMGLNK